ncbi:MAG TPA: hypothetical protein VKA46_38600 [Gemmataceae bacterium]|nr:hypothetical protein [Gemmataceae bacterium]
MSEKTAELAERLREHFSGPMSEEEVEFLRDVQGAIEFAIRNGLSFAPVLLWLSHDLGEIVRNGCDLGKAKAQGFQPKVTGYSKITEEDFGESEEPPA